MKRFLILVLSVVALNVSGQDTIYKMNGKIISGVQVLESENARLIKYMTPNNKMKVVIWEDVYSVVMAGKTTVIYQQDTGTGSIMSQKDMWSYVQGMQYARKVYHTPIATLFGIGVGAGSARITPFYGLPGPALYTVFKGLLNPKIRSRKDIDPYLLYDEHFVQGYKNTARNKKVRNTIFGGLFGYLGMVVFLVAQ
ncbi:MAG: hypothetical protein KKA07_18435 [Bacteroidetes bacterium]|nr:hypothetical protein [Bacteroidota bacterium]MBU1721050.1 hypothetical protein [Bacteroidota bacterium]